MEHIDIDSTGPRSIHHREGCSCLPCVQLRTLRYIHEDRQQAELMKDDTGRDPYNNVIPLRRK